MHFTITENTKEHFGRTLHQIRATQTLSFENQQTVHAGDLGGWVESSKNLGGLAWVYPNAHVLDKALVTGLAQIKGEASVYRNALVDGLTTVSDKAAVCGNAYITGNATVSGSATVYDNAVIFGHANIHGDARIGGNTNVKDSAIVTDNAFIGGDVTVGGHARIMGSSRLSGHITIEDEAIISGDFRHRETCRIGTQAHITDNKHLFICGPYGIYHEWVTLYRTKTGHTLRVGNWEGTIPEYITQAEKQALSMKSTERAIMHVSQATALTNLLTPIAAGFTL